MSMDFGPDAGPDSGPDVSGPVNNSTCPELSGPVTLSILSFNGLTNCQMMWRQGDTQPYIAVQMMANGTPVNVAGATVTVNFIVPGLSSFVQSSSMTVSSDNETCTYSRQATDYTTVNPGHYYVNVTARWPDGTGFTAPDTAESTLLVMPQY